MLHREFGCEQTPAPPLQGKAVENGKSAMGFMVPGGDGVSVDDPGSFSVLLKELNAEEVASLPALLPPMLQHYGGAEGTLLARHIGWVRCTAPSAERRRANRCASTRSSPRMRRGRRRARGMWCLGGSRST